LVSIELADYHRLGKPTTFFYAVLLKHFLIHKLKWCNIFLLRRRAVLTHCYLTIEGQIYCGTSWNDGVTRYSVAKLSLTAGENTKPSISRPYISLILKLSGAL